MVNANACKGRPGNPDHPDTPILLAKIPNRLRRADGARVDFSTIWEWATTGPVENRLPTSNRHGLLYTTINAARAYMAANTQPPTKGPMP